MDRDWKIGTAVALALFGIAFATGEPQANELTRAPTEAHAGAAAVYRVTGNTCPIAKTWVDESTNDLWIDCGADRPVYVWEAHTGDLYAYAGWGKAFASRPDIE